MRRKYFASFLKGMLLIQLFILSVTAGLTMDFSAIFPKVMQKLQMINVPFSRIEISQRQADMMFLETYLPFLDDDSLLNLGLNKMHTANIAENMIDSQMQVLAYTGPETMPEVESEPVHAVPPNQDNVQEEAQEEQKIDNQLFKGKKIFIYCTHSAESYIPDTGKARLDGKRGLVNVVAENLQKNLSAQGLPAEFIDKIHDYPAYDQSYTNSRSTVKQILQTNNNVLALFDVHRDSLPGTTKAATVIVDGRKTARILIIVGTDERKPHPEWKKNLAFAEALYEQGEKMYPGLIKGVTTKAGTYNQEFHPHALLLEFGSDYNTLEEANYATQLFSDILIQVLKEEMQLQ
jgi:stage II sporulation protein P